MKHRDELEALLQAVFREKPTAHWVALFDEHDVPVSPIQMADEVLCDPQLLALQQLEEMALPGQNGNTVRVPKLPFELSETPAEIASPPPVAGEHGREILSEFGYSDADIERLFASGICRMP